MPTRPPIHGHRGARGCRPENTLAAVEYALRQGVDGVEVDLCVTADGAVVIHHDLRLNPDTTRDAHGNWIAARTPLCDLPLAALRQYDVGRLRPGSAYAAQFPEQTPLDGARIPTLDECVEWVRRQAGNDVVLNLEIKSDPRQPKLTPPPPHYAARIADKLDQLRLPKQTFLQSFDWNLLELLTKELNRRNLNFPTGFTKARPYGPPALQTAANKGANIFSCDHRALTKPLVQQAHALGLEVYVWTVNEKSDIARMIEWGVDAITTDYPERCRAVFCGG